ncbi:hypothetical protein L0Y41_02840 [bacterium]|nr:hypothetical protein [bacterium]
MGNEWGDECMYFFTAWLPPAGSLDNGAPDDVTSHVAGCNICHAALVAHCGITIQELRGRWKAGEPERIARARYEKDWDEWFKTWRGSLYSLFGGPFWSRRARWLGSPQREDYKPEEKKIH